MGRNPVVPVIILRDMLGGELLNIHKCQSRKSGEDEYITELSEDPALSIENKHGGYYKLQGE